MDSPAVAALAVDWRRTCSLRPAETDAKAVVGEFAASMAATGEMREIDTAPVMRHALFALFPEVSKRSLKSSDQLTADDLSDEQSNFVKIKAGVMPQMNTDGGWNYAARLGWWERLQQENPEAVGEMSPASQEMMARWIEALRQQDTQYGQNAEGHNYRYRHATRTLTRFYEAASMQPDEVKFYLFRQTAEGKTQKRLVTLSARSCHGSGNYASESSAAANATIVAGLKLPARTYGTGTPSFGSWEDAE